jgi:ABC-type multidrug transport system ATPase subunit
METIIQTKDISYSIGDKHILSSINLSVCEGDIFALLGKNGAGKTTLFEIILGDLKATKGNVLFNKIIQSNYKNVGIVYDHLPLFPLLKVKEIIDYFTVIHKLKINEVPLKYLKNFGLDSLLDSYVKDLSQGEKKKVGLFLSIIHNPILLILDEPFSNIDPTVIDTIWSILKGNNRTIIFTTHNWKEVEKIATQIAFIYEGNIIDYPKTVNEIINGIPNKRKIVTDFNENLINRLVDYQFYINDNLIHVFYPENPQLLHIVREYSNNFSFQDTDIKDAYLYKISQL